MDENEMDINEVFEHVIKIAAESTRMATLTRILLMTTFSLMIGELKSGNTERVIELLMELHAHYKSMVTEE